MENTIMTSSWLASVILVLVGLIKLPFSKFKEKHPKWYKVTFFIVSFILVVVGSILASFYLMNASLKSWEFVSLIIGTGFIVFGGYSAYECTGLKNVLNNLYGLLKKIPNNYNVSKLVKIIKQVGIEKLNILASTIMESQEQNKSGSVNIEGQNKSEDVNIEEQIKFDNIVVAEQIKLGNAVIEEQNKLDNTSIEKQI